MSTDLVERLREESEYLSQSRDFRGPLSVVVSLSDAATALESLRSDVERLTKRVGELDHECEASMATISDERERAEIAESHVERLTAERDEAVVARGRLQDSNSDMAHKWTEILRRADVAESSLAAERRRVEELEKKSAKLCDWITLWDRVCNVADPDDRAPPSWDEVRKAALPDWAPHATRSADGWAAYMEARLVLLVRGFVHALAVKQEG